MKNMESEGINTPKNVEEAVTAFTYEHRIDPAVEFLRRNPKEISEF